MTTSVPFGSLLSKIIDNRGKTCPTSEAGIPLIATNCIKNEHLYPVYEKVRYVSQEVYDSWFRGHPEPGDLIFVLKGTPGRVNWVNNPVDFCIAQDMVALRVDENKVYPKYLFAVLRSSQIQQEIEGLHVGSLIPHFKKSDFDDLQIPLVEEKLQKYIGDVYFNLSLKIDLLHRQNKTLEAMAETLFRQWFIEEAKEDWEEVKLGDLCEVITKGTTPKQFLESGVNFIKAESLTDTGSFIRSKFASVSTEIHDTFLKRSILQAGDLLFSIAGTIGRVAKVTADILPANTNQALAILRPKSHVNSDLIYCILKSSYFQELADGKVVHAVQPNLSLGEISNSCIRLPNQKVLQVFTEQVSAYFAKKSVNSSQIQTLENLRDTLLPKLMSGEVRVQYQTEEVA